MSNVLRGISMLLFAVASGAWLGVLTIGLLGVSSSLASTLWLPLMLFAGIMILIANRDNLGRIHTGIWVFVAIAGFLLILTHVPEFESIVTGYDPYGRYLIYLASNSAATALAFSGTR